MVGREAYATVLIHQALKIVEFFEIGIRLQVPSVRRPTSYNFLIQNIQLDIHILEALVELVLAHWEYILVIYNWLHISLQ